MYFGYWDAFFPLNAFVYTRLIIFTEDVDFRGRESEIEDRGSGIGKSNNNNYKNCRNKYKKFTYILPC